MMVEMNGSMISIFQKYHIHNLGKHWFSNNSMTNILSLNNIDNKFRITIDTSIEYTMKVYFPK